MRLASTTITRNYLSHLEKNLSNKYASETRINSYRQFQQASEMPAQAATAMRVRKAIANLDNYQYNLDTASSIYASAESSVMSISELIQSTYEKCIQAANGTYTDDQLEMIALEVDSYADEICRLMNLTVADRKIFGGTNNSSNAFTIETTSTGSKYVTYNGVDINLYSDPDMYPYSNASYTDIGLGMTLNEDGTVDEQSALQITFNGAEILGCGIAATTAFIDLSEIEEGTEYSFTLAVGSEKYSITFTGGETESDSIDAINEAIADATGTDRITVLQSGTISNQLNSEAVTVTSTGDNVLAVENQGTGYSNNVIQNILDAAQAIRDGDGDAIARFADQVYSLQTTVSLALANIGATTKFIEFNQTRITNNLETMMERQNDLESTDLASESGTWKLLSSIYSATLQMSSSVIPQSIFDFI